MGNPCTKIEGYRSFVIATLPQLRASCFRHSLVPPVKWPLTSAPQPTRVSSSFLPPQMLDSREITRSERIEANQKHAAVRSFLIQRNGGVDPHPEWSAPLPPWAEDQVSQAGGPSAAPSAPPTLLQMSGYSGSQCRPSTRLQRRQATRLAQVVR